MMRFRDFRDNRGVGIEADLSGDRHGLAVDRFRIESVVD
jgi:hypothetical protein